jgi:large subunit ribosomal protein L22
MKTNNEHTARVIGRDLAISTKQAIEISKCIRGKSLQKSKAFLHRVLKKTSAVPFTRFNRDMGHKPGPIAAGRYPENSTKAILALLDSVESNAQNKGLDTENLVISSIIPNKASRPSRFGRKRRIRAKRTHVEIVVEEQEQKISQEKDATKPVKQEEKVAQPTPKKEEKPVEKKIEEKVEKKEVKTEKSKEEKKEETKK